MKGPFHTAVLLLMFLGSLATLIWLCVQTPFAERRVEQPAVVDVSGRDSPAYHRIIMKDKLADEVAAGRLSLFEAAARVRDMKLPEFMVDLMRRADGAATDEEGFCRHMLEWTVLRIGYNEGPVGAERMRERLEAELQARMDIHGTLKLRPPRRRIPALFEEDW